MLPVVTDATLDGFEATIQSEKRSIDKSTYFEDKLKQIRGQNPIIAAVISAGLEEARENGDDAAMKVVSSCLMVYELLRRQDESDTLNIPVV